MSVLINSFAILVLGVGTSMWLYATYLENRREKS